MNVGSSGNLGPRLERGTAGLRGEPAGGGVHSEQATGPERRSVGDGEEWSLVTWLQWPRQWGHGLNPEWEHLGTWEWRRPGSDFNVFEMVTLANVTVIWELQLCLLIERHTCNLSPCRGLHSAKSSHSRMGDGIETTGSESTHVPAPVQGDAKGTAKSSSLLDPTLPSWWWGQDPKLVLQPVAKQSSWAERFLKTGRVKLP